MNKNANMIMEKLNRNGFESYVVGGAVRDMVMGLSPNDIDITTSATPEDVIRLFPRTFPSGIAFGTVTIIMNDEEFEVTTFRTDGEYLDGRRPETVAFGKSIEEDLSRRDFTINAMAMDIDSKITDPFGGLCDLEKEVIRCVGNSEKRFSEDALRMIRAIRFASRYGFAIEENTFNSIKKFAHTIEKVSLERINQEFTKILLSKNPELGISLLHETGLFDFIFPNISFNDIKGNIKNMNKVPANLELRLTTMFLGVNLEIIGKTLKTLKFTNNTIKNVVALVKGYAELNISNNILKVMNIVGKENIFAFLEIVKAIDEEKFEELNIKANEAIKSNYPTTLKDLAIDGKDLMMAGVKQGKEVGMILNLLLDFVLENPESNNKNILLNLAIKIKK